MGVPNGRRRCPDGREQQFFVEFFIEFIAWQFLLEYVAWQFRGWEFEQRGFRSTAARFGSAARSAAMVS